MRNRWVLRVTSAPRHAPSVGSSTNPRTLLSGSFHGPVANPRQRKSVSSPRKRGPIVGPMDSRVRGNDVTFRRVMNADFQLSERAAGPSPLG